MKRVIVRQYTLGLDGYMYYWCQPRMTTRGEVWKCGVCSRGNINPFGRRGIDDKCKFCGAELQSSTYGANYDLRMYCP